MPRTARQRPVVAAEICRQELFQAVAISPETYLQDLMIPWRVAKMISGMAIARSAVRSVSAVFRDVDHDTMQRHAASPKIVKRVRMRGICKVNPIVM